MEEDLSGIPRDRHLREDREAIDRSVDDPEPAVAHEVDEPSVRLDEIPLLDAGHLIVGAGMIGGGRHARRDGGIAGEAPGERRDAGRHVRLRRSRGVCRQPPAHVRETRRADERIGLTGVLDRVERVGHDPVEAPLPEDPVRFEASMEQVSASSAGDHVVTRIAVDAIDATAADERVVTVPAHERRRPGSADGHAVVPVAAAHHEQGATHRHVDADHVVARTPLDDHQADLGGGPPRDHRSVDGELHPLRGLRIGHDGDDVIRLRWVSVTAHHQRGDREHAPRFERLGTADDRPTRMGGHGCCSRR